MQIPGINIFMTIRLVRRALKYCPSNRLNEFPSINWLADKNLIRLSTWSSAYFTKYRYAQNERASLNFKTNIFGMGGMLIKRIVVSWYQIYHLTQKISCSLVTFMMRQIYQPCFVFGDPPKGYRVCVKGSFQGLLTNIQCMKWCKSSMNEKLSHMEQTCALKYSFHLFIDNKTGSLT